jgi:hypothetical protein
MPFSVGNTLFGTGTQTTPVPASGTITAVNVSQQLLPASSSRAGWFVQNLSNDVMYINDLGAATAGNDSIAIPAGTIYEPTYVTGSQINIMSPSLGDYFCKSWSGSITPVVSGASGAGQLAASSSFSVVPATEFDGRDVFITGAATQSAAGNNILLAVAGSTPYDSKPTTNQSYRSLYVQVVGSAGISAGQIVFEGSNDNVTFIPVTAVDEQLNSTVSGNITVAASSSKFYSLSLKYKYIRARISTAFVGGTIQAFSVFSPEVYQEKQYFNTSAGNQDSTITTGLTAQTVVASNVNRKYLEIFNLSSGDLFIKFGGTAAVDSGFKIQAGGYYYTPTLAVPTGALSIIGATTGQKFSYLEV